MAGVDVKETLGLAMADAEFDAISDILTKRVVPFGLLTPPFREGDEPGHIADADALALDHDAKLCKLAERARKTLGFHAEATSYQRLLIGQCDARGAGDGRGLPDKKSGNALRR